MHCDFCYFFKELLLYFHQNRIIMRLLHSKKRARIWQLFHILFMTDIMNSNGVAVDRICIIPIACLCHMPFLPPFNCWLTSQRRLLNTIDCINSLVDVSKHIFVRINVRVFQTHIPVESPNLSYSKRFDDIFIMHLSFRILI